MAAIILTFCKAWGARFLAVLWRGSSIKTADFEIRASTETGVVQIMRELQAMRGREALPRLSKNDSLSGTVQAEEPMTVKG